MHTIVYIVTLSLYFDVKYITIIILKRLYIFEMMDNSHKCRCNSYLSQLEKIYIYCMGLSSSIYRACVCDFGRAYQHFD